MQLVDELRAVVVSTGLAGGEEDARVGSGESDGISLTQMGKAVSPMVYRHPKPQIPPLRCGMTNKKEAKLYTNGHSALARAVLLQM
jgi:hypothetical protein